MTILITAMTIISYLFSIYFVKQGMRDVIDRPIVYSETNLFFLILIFGWTPIIIAGYLTFIDYGFIGVIFLLIFRFLLLTTLFNNIILKTMDRFGF